MSLLEIIRKLREILPAKDKAKLFFLFVLMIIGAGLEVLSIGIIAGFVAAVANPKIIFQIEWLKPILSFFGIETSRDILIYGSIFLILVFLFKNIYIILYKYIKVRFTYHRYKSLSDRLFSLYMNVPYSFHLRRNSADLIRNTTQETDRIAHGVITPILEIATETAMMIGIVSLLLIVEPLVTLATLILLGGTCVLYFRITRKKIHKYGKKSLLERARIIKTVNEGIGGFKDMAVMNRQSWFIERFQNSTGVLSKTEIFKNVTKQSVRPIIETIAVIGMLGITLILLNQGHTIASLASILALFALSIQRLLPALNTIVSNYSAVRYHVYSLEPIHDDLTKLKEYKKRNEEEKERKKEKQLFQEKIEMKNVDYFYPETLRPVLENISLTIKKGEVIGIVGVTGSGKTTMVDLILGLLEPSKGEIKVDGENIKKDLFAWQRNIGYIPQFIYLSDDTIKNNIAFGIEEKEIDDEKVERSAQMAQLNEFTDKLPEKLDTFIGERGIRLSGGQRQRIGIARALYNDPEVLVMDEATSSLDNITERYVIESIERLKKNRTVIIIAHRLTTVQNCDNLYVVKDGKITSQGKYDELSRESEDFKLMTE